MVTLCFIRGKRFSQVANKIAQVFRKILIAHLVEVIASLLIRHDDQTQHFFSSQSSCVVWFLRSSSIFPVNVGEIPLTR